MTLLDTRHVLKDFATEPPALSGPEKQRRTITRDPAQPRQAPAKQQHLLSSPTRASDSEVHPYPLAANLLLQQLTLSDRALIAPAAEMISAPAGSLLLEAGTRLHDVYFPIDGVISLTGPRGLEIAIIGKEGMLGLSAIAEETQFPFRAIVRGDGGRFLRFPAASVRAAADKSPTFNRMLRRYFSIVAVQMSEAIAVNALHGIEARISRWLLMRHDRARGDEIRTQHDEIAACLGTRRASVTDSLHQIEGRLHIRCRRGRIQIRDRASLETAVLDCYGSAEEHYELTFGKFSKSKRA